MASFRRSLGLAFALVGASFGGLLAAGCETTSTSGHADGHDPRITRPGLFEVRRGGPTGPLVAVVWRLQQPQGTLVYDPALWPVMPGDMEFDTGMGGPGPLGLCGEAHEMPGPKIQAVWHGGFDPLEMPPALTDEQPCE